MKFLKSSTLKFILKLIVSTVLLFIIFRSIGVGIIYNELALVQLKYVLISIIIGPLSILLIAIRWKNIIRIFNADINLKSLLNYTFISFAFGIATPGRLGELVKVKYLSDKTGISHFKSLITVIIEKFFDVLVLVLLSLTGLSLLGNTKTMPMIFISLAVFYFLILLILFVYFDKIIKLIAIILPEKWKQGFKDLKITRTIYTKSLIYSLFVWLISSVQLFYIMKALGISISILYVASIMALLAISSIVPISIGGIGIREIVAISFFSTQGITAEKSTAFSLVYTFVGLGVPAIIGAFLYAKNSK